MLHCTDQFALFTQYIKTNNLYHWRLFWTLKGITTSFLLQIEYMHNWWFLYRGTNRSVRNLLTLINDDRPNSRFTYIYANSSVFSIWLYRKWHILYNILHKCLAMYPRLILWNFVKVEVNQWQNPGKSYLKLWNVSSDLKF